MSMKIVCGLSAGALALAAATSHAQSADKFYVAADGGAAFQDQTSIRNGNGFASVGDVKFNTGFRAGLVLGCNWCPSFATELDASVVRNSINTIGSDDLSAFGARADLTEIPLLANAIYTVPIKGPWKPYIGFGLGAAISRFDSANIPLSYYSGGDPHYRDTDVPFAYQAVVGLKYSVIKNVDLGIAYKFTGTTDHGWTDNGINFQTGGTMTHSILATVTWRF